MKQRQMLTGFLIFFFICSSVLVLPPAAVAKTKIVKYKIEFDIVTRDMKCLGEPDGELKFWLPMSKRGAKYAYQIEDEIKKYLVVKRKEIHGYMAEACKAMAKAKKTGADEKLLRNLNRAYKDQLAEIEKQVNAIFEKEWKDLKKRKKELRKDQIKTRLKGIGRSAKGVFTIARAAASGGLDFAAVAKIGSAVIDIGMGMYEAYKGPAFSSLTTLKRHISGSKKDMRAMTKPKNKNKLKEIVKDIKLVKKDLDTTRKSYRKNLARIETKHATLRKRLPKMTAKIEELEKKAKKRKDLKKIEKTKKAVEGAEKMLVEMLEPMNEGKRIVKKAEAVSAQLAEIIKASKSDSKLKKVAGALNVGNVEKLQKGIGTVSKLWQKHETKIKGAFDKLKEALE